MANYFTDLTTVPDDFGDGGKGLSGKGSSVPRGQALVDFLQAYKAALEALDAALPLGGLAEVADPGDGEAIPVGASAIIGFTHAGAETNTLADPTFVGQKLVLYDDVATSGARVVTAASAVNQAGNTSLTFNAAGETLVLEAIAVGGAPKWRVTANDGVTLA